MKISNEEKARDMICKDCVCVQLCIKEKYKTPCKKYITSMQMHEWTKKQIIKKVFELLNETLINCEHENGEVYVTDSVATSKEDFLKKFKKMIEK